MENKEGKILAKPNNIIPIPTSLDTTFFRWWVEILKPLHKLTEREMDVITAFLKKRYELSKDILDPIKLDKYLMSDDVKKEIREECNITSAHFQVIMGKLKKQKILKDGRITPKFIPNVKEEDDNFQLLFYFSLNDLHRGS